MRLRGIFYITIASAALYDSSQSRITLKQT